MPAALIYYPDTRVKENHFVCDVCGYGVRDALPSTFNFEWDDMFLPKGWDGFWDAAGVFRVYCPTDNLS